MGIARFVYGASPSRSEVTPITAPAESTSAAPPKAGLEGDTTKARSSMYSHAAENGRTASSRPARALSRPSSATPTVPTTSPDAALVESPSAATGQGPGPSSFTTPTPTSRSRATRRAGTLRPSRRVASMRSASSTM